MSETILEIKDLKILWRQSHPPRSFSGYQKGEVVVILGPSGCGKKHSPSLPQWSRNHTRWRHSSGWPVHY